MNEEIKQVCRRGSLWGLFPHRIFSKSPNRGLPHEIPLDEFEFLIPGLVDLLNSFQFFALVILSSTNINWATTVYLALWVWVLSFLAENRGSKGQLCHWPQEVAQELRGQEAGSLLLSGSPKLLPTSRPLQMPFPLHLLFPLPGRLCSLIGSFSPFLSPHKGHSLWVTSLTHLTPFHHCYCQGFCSCRFLHCQDRQSKEGWEGLYQEFC